jgi:6-pyruvoyltetrahydropterin/6-carboxytetrahydropterin synthase
MFDHTVLIAEDDPHLDSFMKLQEIGAIRDGANTALLDLRIVPAVGCERFAQLAYDTLSNMLDEDRAAGKALNNTVRVKSVEVFEHGANSAIYEG